MVNLMIARKKKNLTQLDLAVNVDCSEVTISQLERGKAKPSVSLLIKLADELEVTTDFLLGREEKK